MKFPFAGSYRLNQRFNDPCCRQTYVNAFGWIGHNGQDWNLPNGTPVLAAHAGKVFNGSEPSGYGNYVFVTGGGYESVYGHLRAFATTQGAQVQEGQTIGYSDNTGFSSGPHLHFGLRPIPYNRNNGFGGYIDPAPLLTQTNSGGIMALSQGVIDAFTLPMKDADEARYYREILGRQRESGPSGRTYGGFVFDAVPEIIQNTRERLALRQRIAELEAAGGATLSSATVKQLLEAALKKV